MYGNGFFNPYMYQPYYKTLNVVNQAIPIFYQVKPMFNNAKTMFRIMGAMKDDDNKNTTTNNIQSKNISNQSTKKELNTISNYQTYQEENPTFFI